MDTTPPLLLLSSGQAPQYLDDIVRALALPSGGRIQFRYRLALVANAVADAVRKGRLVGRTCYVAYLDISTRGKKPELVPVREAEVVEATIRGSSLILKMRARRYILTTALPAVRRLIEGSVADALPQWKSEDGSHTERAPAGYWVNFLTAGLSDDQLATHEPDGDSKYLEYFESSVKTLCTYSDFAKAGRSLFFNVIGLRDINGQYVSVEPDGGWKLASGKDYRLDIYHYTPKESSTTSVGWIGCRATGDAVKMFEPVLLRADNAYDEKTVTLRTIGAVRRTQNALSVFRATDREDEGGHSAELIFPVEVAVDTGWNLLQAAFIGVPSIAAGWSAMDWSQDGAWLKALLIFVAGAFAGGAAVYKKP